MTGEENLYSDQRMDQIIEALKMALVFAEELRAIHGERHGDVASQGCLPDENVPESWTTFHRPWADPSTLSIVWAGKSCYLGYTKLFRLAERLFRRPNQFVEEERLLDDVWGGDRKSSATVRSAVRNLRQRLHGAGMDALASAIQTHSGRYGLILCDSE